MIAIAACSRPTEKQPSIAQVGRSLVSPASISDTSNEEKCQKVGLRGRGNLYLKFLT